MKPAPKHLARLAWGRSLLAGVVCAPVARAQGRAGPLGPPESPPTSARLFAPAHPAAFAVAAFAYLAALISLAFAQPPPPADPPTLLPPFWVEADATQPDDFAPRSFALTRDARSARSAATLKDSLADAPGVLLQESFGGFEPPRLSIRGSGLQSAPSSRGVAFLLDGFPLGLADGSFNSALVEPQFADRIELFRGDASAALAPAVLGGAFNLRTDGDSAPAALRVATGSFGAMQASLSGRLNSAAFSFDGAAAFTGQDGFREHSTQHRAALFASAGNSPASVSVYHTRAAYDVPGPLTLTAAALDPSAVSADVRRDQPRRDSELTQITARIAQQNSVFALDAGVSWLRTADWFRQLQANGIGDSHSDDITLHAALARHFDSSAGENLLRLGTTLSRGWRDLRRFRNDSAATGPLFGHDGLFATNASVDLEGTASLPAHLSLTAGVTALAARRDISDRLTAGATSLRLHSTALNPRARLTWTATPALTFHASVAQAVEPPTFDDLLVVAGAYPNLTRRSQPLLNQSATTAELGASGQHGAFGWDLTAYTADWRHEILRLADARGQPRGAVNADPTRHRGLEASARWRLLDRDQRLTLVTTAAWNQFTFVNDPPFANNRLAGAPPHQGSASLLYEHPRGFFAAPALEWTAGATPVDHAGKLRYGGATLAHLRLGWRRARTWTVFAEIKNVFDRAHIASTAGVLDLARNPAATAVFLPGAPRTFTLGLECLR